MMTPTYEYDDDLAPKCIDVRVSTPYMLCRNMVAFIARIVAKYGLKLSS